MSCPFRLGSFPTEISIQDKILQSTFIFDFQKKKSFPRKGHKPILGKDGKGLFPIFAGTEWAIGVDPCKLILSNKIFHILPEFFPALSFLLRYFVQGFHAMRTPKINVDCHGFILPLDRHAIAESVCCNVRIPFPAIGLDRQGVGYDPGFVPNSPESFCASYRSLLTLSCRNHFRQFHSIGYHPLFNPYFQSLPENLVLSLRPGIDNIIKAWNW